MACAEGISEALDTFDGQRCRIDGRICGDCDRTERSKRYSGKYSNRGRWAPPRGAGTPRVEHRRIDGGWGFESRRPSALTPCQMRARLAGHPGTLRGSSGEFCLDRPGQGVARSAGIGRSALAAWGSWQGVMLPWVTK